MSICYERRRDVLDLRESGLSYRKIEAHTGVSRNTVAAIVHSGRAGLERWIRGVNLVPLFRDAWHGRPCSKPACDNPLHHDCVACRAEKLRQANVAREADPPDAAGLDLELASDERQRQEAIRDGRISVHAGRDGRVVVDHEE